MEDWKAGLREFLERGKAEARRWEERELTEAELADMRAPFATGSGEDLMWRALELVYWKVPADHPRMHELLTEGQRGVLALWRIYTEVANGGLHQFFLNHTGYLLPEAIAGAELLGETGLANKLRRASSYLGEPYPRDYDQRNRALAGLPDPTTRSGNNSTTRSTRDWSISRRPGSGRSSALIPTSSSCRDRARGTQICRSASR